MFMATLRSAQRNADAKNRAARARAIDLNSCAMLVRDPAPNSEPKSGTTRVSRASRINTVEAIEDASPLPFRNTRTGVGNLEYRCRISFSQRYRYPSAGGRKLNGIIDENQKQPL